MSSQLKEQWGDKRYKWAEKILEEWETTHTLPYSQYALACLREQSKDAYILLESKVNGSFLGEIWQNNE